MHVKPARPLSATDIGQAAADASLRGLADALIVAGVATGHAPDPTAFMAVRKAVPDARLWLGSGLTVESCAVLAPYLDGAIVGSAAQEGGKAGNPVDPARARAVAEAFRA